jgi:predicted DCC family thiol-disulfide oxidoreductase YuxK
MAIQDLPTPHDSNVPIILYDGTCNLCTKSVQFVIQRDRRKQFRFASLQSTLADQYLGKTGRYHDRFSSMVLIVGNQVYRQSTAALLTAKRLDGLWPMLAVFLWIPKPLRDGVYSWVAKHRYQVFGGKESCWRPTSDLADRFLDI